MPPLKRIKIKREWTMAFAVGLSQLIRCGFKINCELRSVKTDALKHKFMLKVNCLYTLAVCCRVQINSVVCECREQSLLQLMKENCVSSILKYFIITLKWWYLYMYSSFVARCSYMATDFTLMLIPRDNVNRRAFKATK